MGGLVGGRQSGSWGQVPMCLPEAHQLAGLLFLHRSWAVPELPVTALHQPLSCWKNITQAVRRLSGALC